MVRFFAFFSFVLLMSLTQSFAQTQNLSKIEQGNLLNSGQNNTQDKPEQKNAPQSERQSEKNTTMQNQISIPTTNSKKISEMDDENFGNIAVIRITNKITAKSEDFRVKIGDFIEYETIKITPYKCWKSPTSEKDESKILLKVDETIDTIINNIFTGWLFSSSQSASSLEHNAYDVVAVDCLFE